VVKTDNGGAMFMTQHSSTSRHVDTSYHFVVEDGIVKGEFVNSSENDSDIFTKKVSQETYKRHGMKFLVGIGDNRSECTFRSRKGIGNIPSIHSKISFYMFTLSIRDIYS
jgi:hypothetical protein